MNATSSGLHAVQPYTFHQPFHLLPNQMFRQALRMMSPAARSMADADIDSIARNTAGRLVLTMDLVCKVLP